MKIPCVVFGFLVVLPPLKAQDANAMNAFQKLPYEQRLEIISKAPVAQQSELQKAHMHAILLHQYGSEENLKMAKESHAAKARGVGSIEKLFQSYHSAWDSYIAGVVINNESSNLTPRLQHEALEKIKKEKVIATQRFSSVHSIVSKIVPTSDATALSTEAATLQEKLVKKLVSTSPAKINPYIDKGEMDQLDRQLSEMFEKLKILPVLSTQQVEEGINAVPEEELYKHTMF